MYLYFIWRRSHPSQLSLCDSIVRFIPTFMYVCIYIFIPEHIYAKMIMEAMGGCSMKKCSYSSFQWKDRDRIWRLAIIANFPLLVGMENETKRSIGPSKHCKCFLVVFKFTFPMFIHSLLVSLVDSTHFPWASGSLSVQFSNLSETGRKSTLPLMEPTKDTRRQTIPYSLR